MTAHDRRILSTARQALQFSREERAERYKNREAHKLPADLFEVSELVRLLVQRDARQLLGNILTGVIVGVVILLVKYLAGMK